MQENNKSSHTKQWSKIQPLWHDRDLFKVSIFGAIIGFIVGVAVGYEWAWQPVVTCFRPLIA